MGKASSSKKVARAARAGGRVSSRQPRGILFPGVLTLVVLLGLALVVFARNDRLQDDLGGPPLLEDHFHQAFGIFVCDGFRSDIPEFESQNGIHTHGDGVIHIHPFSSLATGANATLGRFLDDAGAGGVQVTLDESALSYLGETVEEGETTCDDVDDPQLRMAYWPNVQDEESLPEVTTGSFRDRRLTDDGAGITLYFGARDADIPKPPPASNLSELGARDGGQANDTGTTLPPGQTPAPTDVEPTTTSTTTSTTTTAAPAP